MSSKKVASKENTTKKAPAKAAAKPAAKAPAKKTATASASKKTEKPAAKAPAKPAAKSAPAKSATKVTAPAKAAKPAAKAPAKAAAKPAPAKAPAKPETKKPVPQPKKVEEKPAAKPAPAVQAKPVEKENVVVKPASSVEKVKDESVEQKVKPVVKAELETSASEVVEKPKSKNMPDYDYAVLLQGVKRLSKTIMFIKVDETEDRSNKKKMSSDVKNLEMKPTSPIRHKASLAEETQEELTERILKELEEQNRMFEREAATQMCTRCNRNLVSPEFWVDKHLGFCEECAAILKLGQSKEARKVEYQLGAMDGDSLDEEDDDIIGPDAEDLKEAEEDLAEMDD